MNAFVTALSSDVTAAGLWGAIAPAAPIIGVGVLVGFGYMVLRRAVKGIGKGKGSL